MNQSDAKSLGIDMLERSYGKWWLMLLDGLCFIALSVFAIFFSNQAITLLIFIFGVYRGIMGIIYIVSALVMRHRYGAKMGFSLGRGIFDLIICIIFLLVPNVIVAFFIVIIGIWAIITGIFLLIISANSGSVGRIVKIVMGVALIGFGIYAFINPMGPATIIVMLVGAAFGIFGLFLVIQSIGMKRTFTQIKKVKRGYEDYHIE
ncbi:HdeD family acid-resistance protein [Acetobacterium sp.]|uniref:HdeD family acid-resistance protein n=1 Tax=Acetobacterium sp. TaxID=1872094 RepID=UPI0035933019